MVAILSSVALTAYAEDAPVYDVDNYPPQFDGQPDSGHSSQAATSKPEQTPTAQSPVPSQEQDVPVASSSQSLPLDQRIARMEQQLTNLQRSQSATKLNDLQSEIQALRGQVEELTHQLQQMQSQQRSMYSDLDKRINKQAMTSQIATQQPSPDDDLPVPPKTTLKPKQPKSSAIKSKTKVASAADAPMDASATDSATPPAEAAVVSKNAQPSANSEQEELQMYQSAYDLIKDSKFDQAIAVLQNMLKKYPSGQSAANAHYWLGELYGLQKKKDQAAAEFASVVKNYPDSPKVSDAQVKLGMIYAAQFKWADAKSTFKKVMSHYPGTTSARLAAQQLKEIKAGGH
jgi:tol-pal system protein YbgF